ncbi:hypothetical protein SAY86_017889 [Trapa natans]|uniref:Uncharacterized protein n=1 Tax=Trapa natans TaxID=22666 RepID=A0AAN7M707_TRANT|nr:hypothetical protein SAY86_017889 [Trapa natans]
MCIAGELDAGHEVSEEDVPFLDDVHVEEVREGGDVEEGDDVGVDIEEEREGRGDVGAEDSALVLVHALPEEGLGALEPEVLEPVRYGAEKRPAVASRDGAEWEGGGGKGPGY